MKSEVEILKPGVLKGRQDYALAISKSWSASVAHIIETGKLLQQAKDDLEHGEFVRMFEKNELPWRTVRSAQLLMEVARHPVLSDAIHGSHLPASWRTLSFLAKLPEDMLLPLIKDGTISADMQRTDALRLIQEERESVSLTKEPSAPTCTVKNLDTLIRNKQKFGTIYADPPWLYGNQATRASTGNHYGGMSVNDIADLPIHKLAADDAHLHLWTTNAFLFDARDVIESWGFEYKSCFVWVKPQMGIGNYWRVSHEFMLFGIRGSVPFRDRSLMSWAQLDRTKHSAKPEQVRTWIEKASPGPYLELFARKPSDHWIAWGNEIEETMFDADIRRLD